MSGDNKLTKKEVAEFEKLKQKWKELSIEVYLKIKFFKKLTVFLLHFK